jgi:putative ABC transport system ATP-binding protein
VTLLAFRNVRKTYGEGAAAVNALSGVDLDIQAGEFVAIMGPSGSGKSTAMNVLGCLDRPTSGEYYFNGVEVAKRSNDARTLVRRNYLGFVFQGFNLLARTTAVENVELPLVYRGIGKTERRTRSLKALHQVGLADRAHHRPNELSGGQQQRVAIARAIVSDPLVLLADEPTGNLDTQRSHDIMALLTSLNKERGLTILMVTHEADMAHYASRQIHFADGLIVPEIKVAA